MSQNAQANADVNSGYTATENPLPNHVHPLLV